MHPKMCDVMIRTCRSVIKKNPPKTKNKTKQIQFRNIIDLVLILVNQSELLVIFRRLRGTPKNDWRVLSGYISFSRSIFSSF